MIKVTIIKVNRTRLRPAWTEWFTNNERFVCSTPWPRFHPFNEGNDGKERDGGISEEWVVSVGESIWTIHLKEPVHESHLCMNQTTKLVVLHVQHVERLFKMYVRICVKAHCFGLNTIRSESDWSPEAYMINLILFIWQTEWVHLYTSEVFPNLSTFSFIQLSYKSLQKSWWQQGKEKRWIC